MVLLTMATFSFVPRTRSSVPLACCKVGLDRPLIPTAFVANLSRSARVFKPLPEPAFFEVPGSSRAAATDRSLEVSAPGHCEGTIRSPASYPTRAIERQSSEVWCRPSGARKSRGRMLLSGLGTAPPGSNMPPHSGLGCKGPERILNGAAAMKPWKTSSATNETRSACPSFRLVERPEKTL